MTGTTAQRRAHRRYRFFFPVIALLLLSLTHPGQAGAVGPLDGTVAPLPVPRDVSVPLPAANADKPAPLPGNRGATASPTATAQPAATQPAKSPVPRVNAVAIGVYPPGMEWNPAPLLNSYITTVGTAPAIAMFYEDWATDWMKVFPTATMDAAYARGAMPLMTWEPWDSISGVPNQPAFSLANIIAGTYDPWLHQYARSATAYGKPFYLRLAHEMNGNWVPWGFGVNGNTPAQYIQFWRHVHDIFASERAMNVRWVWNPSTETDTVALSTLYPGNAYVDWMGVDGYNGGTGMDWGGWLTAQQIFGRSYRSLQAINASKPIMIGETASTELGGSKAAWIADLATTLPALFPNVRAVVWFDANKEQDWRVDSSASSLAAWRSLIASAAYQGRLT